MSGATAAIRLQVLWRRLLGIVDEQAQIVQKTAFCTIVRESGDLSVVLYDRAGGMVAQSQASTPGFVRTMSGVVRHLLAERPAERWEDGDAWVTNDPWIGCGHLHDMVVVSPIFAQERLVAFIASAAHVVDVGGRGLGPDARQVYEEGLLLPPVPLLRRGERDPAVAAILRGNVREAGQVEGDVMGLANANAAGARALARLLAAQGVSGVEEVAAFVVAQSEAAMRRALSTVPAGTWRASMTIDGHREPATLRAALTSDGEGAVTLDFAGTSPAVPSGVNVPLNYTSSYAWFALKCALAPEVPANAGSIAPIAFAAPAGTILSAEHPWPVAARHMIGHMVPDLVFGCLAQTRPVQAEGAAALWAPQYRGGPDVRAMARVGGEARTFTAITVHSGGGGGRPGKDGLSATAFPTNLRTVPVEVIEATTPLVVWRRELRPDSAGAGRWRGGFGQIVEVGGADGEPILVNAMFERVDHPARGRDGGGDGAPGRLRLASGAAFSGKGQQIIPPGDRLILETPGGGGLGDPALRDSQATRADSEAGLISAPLPSDDA